MKILEPQRIVKISSQWYWLVSTMTFWRLLPINFVSFFYDRVMAHLKMWKEIIVNYVDISENFCQFHYIFPIIILGRWTQTYWRNFCRALLIAWGWFSTDDIISLEQYCTLFSKWNEKHTEGIDAWHQYGRNWWCQENERI